jgi:hypothetical protein
MAIINNVTEVLHRIRVKLYPNYLPNAEGAYIARTDSEATLNIEQVCAALKNRGGYGGDYEDLVEGVKQFFDETAYQLCDGFAVNTGYFSIHPNVGGTFNSVLDIHDHKKHPVSFRYRTNLKLRRLIEHIGVDIEGVADAAGWIDEFIDTDENAVNTHYKPDNQFVLHGHKIKIAGDDPGVGVYFVPVDDPTSYIKVRRIAENSPAKIIGIAPMTGFARNRIEIRTQFSGGGSVLKSPRVITSPFVLEQATGGTGSGG